MEGWKNWNWRSWAKSNGSITKNNFGDLQRCLEKGVQDSYFLL